MAGSGVVRRTVGGVPEEGVGGEVARGAFAPGAGAGDSSGVEAVGTVTGGGEVMEGELELEVGAGDSRMMGREIRL